MDQAELKLVARRLADVLEQNGHPIKHGQALDLVAAIPGLRDWNEVAALPDRVNSSGLSDVSCARLARRIKERLSLRLTPNMLLAGLAGDAMPPPQVWPEGPAAGVYLGTSKKALEALVSAFDAATDGAPVYAESDAVQHESAIDLGEYGLFSPGLSRLPRGTLIVAAPLGMAQESWDENRDRVRMACRLALECGHRVIVLFNTDLPDEIFRHASIMLPWEATDENSGGTTYDGSYHRAAIRGRLSERGELVAMSADALALAMRPGTAIDAPLRAAAVLPDQLRSLFAGAIQNRRHGLLLLGLPLRDERYQLLEALVSLTAGEGPLARIQGSSRSGGYGSAPTLADAFDGVPVMPSIEAAFDAGYRRMVLEHSHGFSKIMLKYADRARFIVGDWGPSVTGVLIRAINAAGARGDYEAYERVVAAAAIGEVKTAGGVVDVYDAIVPSGPVPEGLRGGREVWDYAQERRTLRCEDQLLELVRGGMVTLAEVSKSRIDADLKVNLKKLLKKTKARPASNATTMPPSKPSNAIVKLVSGVLAEWGWYPAAAFVETSAPDGLSEFLIPLKRGDAKVVIGEPDDKAVFPVQVDLGNAAPGYSVDCRYFFRSNRLTFHLNQPSLDNAAKGKK